MTLDQMKPKTRGVVRRVSATGALGQRLRDLGVYPGLPVRMIRNAPLKDPMEVEVDGTYLSIRHEEARFVEVDPQ
ncbi:MAG: ferrous iron transport protein A [Proteobacteria bacterium]|nr:ferrous iron transport protein A [Pseudomonadota bacterium]